MVPEAAGTPVVGLARTRRRPGLASVRDMAGRDHGIRTFLVERYLSAPDAHEIRATEARIVEALLAPTAGGRTTVRYLGGLAIAEDEVVFYLFRSSSSEAVRDLLRRAATPFERIVESVIVGGVAGSVPAGVSRQGISD